MLMPFFKHNAPIYSFLLCIMMFSFALFAQELDQEIVKTEAKTNAELAAQETLSTSLQYDTNQHSEGLGQIVESQEAMILSNMPSAQVAIQGAKSNSKTLTTDDIKKLSRSPEFDQFQKEFEDTIGLSATKNELGKMASMQKQKKYGEDIEAYIAISMSIPEASLKSLLAELSNEFKDRNVILAFQGAKPGELSKLAFFIERMIPKEAGQFDVVIDPTIFNKLEVEAVPYFAIKTQKGWRKVLGDVSFSQALYLADIDYDIFQAAGPVYEIEEPNMLDVIQSKLANFSGEKYIEGASKKLLEGEPSRVNLLLATKDMEYLVDPTSTIKEDLVFEGVMFAPAGTQINPLEHLPLANSFAFIDVTKQEQVALARQWQSKHQNLRLLTTVMPQAEETGRLINEFGFISQINELVVTRFGLSHYPALAYQVENKIQVEVIAIKPSDDKTPERISE